MSLSVAVALVASRPRWQQRVFGSVTQTHLALGEEVGLGGGRTGWFVPAGERRGGVVIVHGFVLSKTPVLDSPSPLFDFAAVLRDAGYDVLLPTLGYANGVHPFSGGVAEADDVVNAAEWLAARDGGPVAVWGFSFGGHAALLAGVQSDRIAAIVTDSAYDDSAAIVEQASRMSRLPSWLFLLVPRMFPIVAGAKPLRVSALPSAAHRRPTLHIHGDADSAIHPDNLDRLTAATGGDRWLVAGAEHVRAHEVAADYQERVIAFLDSALSATQR